MWTEDEKNGVMPVRDQTSNFILVNNKKWSFVIWTKEHIGEARRWYWYGARLLVTQEITYTYSTMRAYMNISKYMLFCRYLTKKSMKTKQSPLTKQNRTVTNNDRTKCTTRLDSVRKLWSKLKRLGNINWENVSKEQLVSHQNPTKKKLHIQTLIMQGSLR